MSTLHHVALRRWAARHDTSWGYLRPKRWTKRLVKRDDARVVREWRQFDNFTKGLHDRCTLIGLPDPMQHVWDSAPMMSLDEA